MERTGSHFTTIRIGEDQYETTLGIKPINYLKNGGYQPIDPKFTVGQAGVAFENNQLSILRLAANSSSPLLTFGKGTSQVSLEISNGNSVAAVAGARDNEVVYTGILPGINAHIFSGGHVAALELRGDLQDKSLEFKLTPQGAFYEILAEKIRFKDARGNILFNFSLDFEAWKDPIRDGANIFRAYSSVSQGKIVVSLTTPDIVGLDRLV